MGYLVTKPFEIFLDTDGTPLENGYLYFGTVSQNPETNPISIYWDADLTIPAANPVRTVNGYAARNGTPANLYTASNYSITVKDKNGRLVYNSPLQQVLDSAVTQQVNDIATLRTINPSSGRVVYVKRHTDPLDGGDGDFEGLTGAAPGTYTDDNGITIVPTGGDGSSCWRRVIKTSVCSLDYGCSANGVADDTAGLTNLFLTDESIIDIADGQHLISSALTWSGSDKTVRGAGENSEILMTNGFRMINFGDNVSNVTFIGIKFNTTYAQAADQPYGLITSESKNLTNIRFIRCKFTAPNAKANAVKLIAEGTSRLRGVEFEDCEFDNILRMGVEVQNHTADSSVTSLTHAAGVATAQITGHNLSVGDRIQIIGSTTTEWNGLYFIEGVTDANNVTFTVPTSFTSPATGTITAGVYRYERVKVRQCRFKDLPSVPASGYGMGVSLSGYGHYCDVSYNEFNNVYNAVEIVGTSETSVTFNKAMNDVYFLISSTNVRIMYGNDFSHNRSINPVKARMQFQNQIKATISHNITETDNTFQTDAALTLSSVFDSTITHNSYKGRGLYALLMADSARNKISHNTFDNTLSAANNSTFRISGATSTGNRIESNQMRKGTGGVYWDEISSAAGNYFWDNHRDDTVTYATTTWNPGNLVDGAGETSASITVTGAALGDIAFATAPYDLQGITCNAYVDAANSVKVRLQNETGGAIDLASGTWKVRVVKL